MADRHSEHVGSDRIPLQPRRDGGACLSCTTQGETPGECMIGIISLVEEGVFSPKGVGAI